MKNVINIFDTDGYKISQWKQYPKGATYAMSYAESRGGADRVKFFGLQYVLKQLEVPTLEDVEVVKQSVESYTGRTDLFNYEGWKKIAEMGYFPLRVRSVPEGSVIPTKQALFTVENTHPDFVWLISWLETQLLRVWYPTTVATTSFEIKELIAKYLERNGTPESINFKLHDFGARGVATGDQAMLGGMAHLINFAGSDTLAGRMGAVEYYNADTAGLSAGIPASEHSTITSWGRDFEYEAFRNMIEQFGAPGAIYACVSDSYNIWEALETWKDLEPLILEKGGTLVVRPDSGDPVETPVKVVKRLIDLFGYTLNSKGYKVLPDHIRVIQGDGVDQFSIESILRILDFEGISSDNITFGMGGALLQKIDRDTYKFAMKMCAITVDGKDRDVYKDPITAPGKTSKRGFLTLNKDMQTVRINELNGNDDFMDTVWENGEFLKEVNFEDLR